MADESGGPKGFRDTFDLDLAKSVVGRLCHTDDGFTDIRHNRNSGLRRACSADNRYYSRIAGIGTPAEDYWIPGYSPISMTDPVGGEDRPMSSVQSSTYLPVVMTEPPPGCPETLDQFRPVVSSPLVEPSQSPGREDIAKGTETEIFVVERFVGSPPKHFGDWCSHTSGSEFISNETKSSWR